jgi:hypothetical protein
MGVLTAIAAIAGLATAAAATTTSIKAIKGGGGGDTAPQTVAPPPPTATPPTAKRNIPKPPVKVAPLSRTQLLAKNPMLLNASEDNATLTGRGRLLGN